MSSAATFSIHLFNPEEIAILIEHDLVIRDESSQGLWPTSSWRSDAHAALVVLKVRHDRPRIDAEYEKLRLPANASDAQIYRHERAEIWRDGYASGTKDAQSVAHQERYATQHGIMQYDLPHPTVNPWLMKEGEME